MDSSHSFSDPPRPSRGESLLEFLGDGFFDLLDDEGGLFFLAVIAIGFVLYILLRVVSETWSSPPPT